MTFPIITAYVQCEQKNVFCSMAGLDALVHVLLLLGAFISELLLLDKFNKAPPLLAPTVSDATLHPLFVGSCITLFLSLGLILILLIGDLSFRWHKSGEPLPQFIFTLVSGGVNVSFLLTLLATLLFTDYYAAQNSVMAHLAGSLVIKGLLAQHLCANVKQGNYICLHSKPHTAADRGQVYSSGYSNYNH